MEGPGRRLSLPRRVLALLMTAAMATVGFFGYRSWVSSGSGPPVQRPGPAQPGSDSASPWFAGYVDVTLKPAYDFAAPTTGARRDVVLSHIVSSPGIPCTPTWGALFTLDQASTALDLDRVTARLRAGGRRVAVSFGGQLGDELATTCTDVDELAAAYAKVIDRYDIATIDLDLEGTSLPDRVAGQRRAEAILKVQLDHRSSGRALAVWLTLPVSPTGLTQDGQSSVAEMLRAGVDLAGVNAMTMNYGDSRAAGQSMLSASTNALTATARQVKNLYRDAGTGVAGKRNAGTGNAGTGVASTGNDGTGVAGSTTAGSELSDAQAWSKIGATPMIGQNDVPDEVFDLDSARSLNTFAVSRGMGRLSMWSLNRDSSCVRGQVDVKRASSSCSGVAQGARQFADLLAADLVRRM